MPKPKLVSGLLPAPSRFSGYFRSVARLAESALAGPGVLPAGARQAIAAGDPIGPELPPPLAAFAKKVATRAYAVVDEDVEALRGQGFSEDEIFEAAVAAAVGAGLVRLRAGLAALRGLGGK